MSTDRRIGGGAIPVYIVGAPPPDSTPPNTQGNILGAIPVNFTVVQPTVAYAGPIPVRVVAAPPLLTDWPSDQTQDNGAIPVYNTTGPKAIPVWRVN